MNEVPILFQSFRSKLQKNAKKLTKSFKIDEIPNGVVKDAICFGYRSDSTFEVALAVLMNAVIASQKTEFLLSKKLMVEAFSRDPNVDHKEISGTTMSKIAGMITQVGFVERLTESSNSPTKRRIAATYRVTHPEVLSLIQGQYKTLTKKKKKQKAKK